MAQVQLKNIEKFFGSQKVIKDVSIEIRDHEFVVFVGPSGCGKSTLLRSIAGLETIDSGDIIIGDRDVTGLDPGKRRVAMVFQSYALYPNMTVAENIGFGLKINKQPKAEIAAQVKSAADTLQIEQLLERKPRELSGGQRQRVAIGRAIVRQPDVFLFDEPLSNLDAALRAQMRVELIALHQRLSATMIYVTHDQVEAMTMADRIVVLNQGRVEQIGAPVELYLHPCNAFVAGFIGSPKMNFIDVSVTSVDDGQCTVTLPGGGALTKALKAGAKPSVGDKVTLGLRPEHAKLSTTTSDAKQGTIPCNVTLIEPLGGHTMVHVQLADGSAAQVEAPGNARHDAGEPATITMAAESCHLFAVDDGRTLSA